MTTKKKVSAESIIDNFDKFELLKPVSEFSTLAYSFDYNNEPGQINIFFENDTIVNVHLLFDNGETITEFRNDPKLRTLAKQILSSIK
ncbi:hypothetical protein HNY42_13730 [Exiguobacterium sp. Helios]|uniref:hypothetical protein n=1 Tax=Exiguobacterium sp. Helios TaxID=2735868 RepID=UPI00165D63B2|nr:hypothetical protein [Exiguobacterium sp. Helios]QNR21956.1 hypothetical protein HNY42_13730 [Exiguobacterium sp. Helios]